MKEILRRQNSAVIPLPVSPDSLPDISSGKVYQRDLVDESGMIINQTGKNNTSENGRGARVALCADPTHI
jgi:hypothetical protein